MDDLLLQRFAFGNRGTFGRLSLGDFHCFSLEPPAFPWVPENARDVSCIPVGRYLVELGTFYRGTADPSDDYPCLVFHDGEVRGRGRAVGDPLDVPGLKIHAGNLLRHTRGCPLTGEEIGFPSPGSPGLLRSRRALARLINAFGTKARWIRVEELR